MTKRAIISGVLAAVFGLICVCSPLPGMRNRAWADNPYRNVGRIVFTPKVAQPSNANDVVGVLLEGNGGASLQDQAVTFGQVFIGGRLSAGSDLAAVAGGQTFPAQLDVKATNPDGSVRMGVVTLIVPAAESHSNLPVMLVRAPRASARPVDLAGMRNYDLTVDIAVQGGTTHHLIAAQLLAQAVSSGTISYWLRGPLVTEARVDSPVTGSLHVTFDIRAYANGTTQTDIAFKNDYAMQPVGGALTYDVVIQSGGRTAYARTAIAQPQYTNWHKLIGSGGRKSVSVIEDVAALEKSGAILNYDLTNGVAQRVIDENTAEMQKPGFDILGNAGLVMYMGTTGERDDIGPTTMANTVWLLTQRADARAFALAQADAAGSVPWHFYDPARRTFWTTARAPKLRTVDDTKHVRSQGDLPLTQEPLNYKDGCGCWQTDTAHQPDLSFVPYMLTGSHYYLDQLEAQATWDILVHNPTWRLREKGIVLYVDDQIRAKAWNLRGIINAAWIIPDNDPLKKYFIGIQTNNFEYLYAQIHTLHEGEATGWIPGNFGHNHDVGSTAPWQQDYFGLIIILAAERGVPKALDILKWQTGFLAGRLLAEDKGYHAYDGVIYNMYTFAPPNPATTYPDPVGRAYQTWAEIGRVTAANGVSGGGIGWPKGTYWDYLLETRGVLAGIMRLTGSDQAKKAYRWLIAHSPEGAETAAQVNPKWNIAPPRPAD